MNQLAQHGLVVIEGRATYERIASYIREVESEEAIRQIQNFLKIYPEFAQAHNDLAVLYYQAGNGMKALAHYEKAHKLEPANITFRKNLADFYFVELEWADDAIQTYLDILKDNPFDVETLNALGTISVQIGRREQARQYFARTLQLDTVNSQARQALQQLSSEPQLPFQPRTTQHIPFQVTQSLATPSQAPAQSQPLPPFTQAPAFSEPLKSAEQLHRQALELANSGKNSEARLTLQELLGHYPEYAIGHNDLGVLLQQEGDNSQARHHHEEAYRLQPDNNTFQKNLADLLYFACGETEGALKLYLELLGSNPKDIETLKAISYICLDIGKTEDARSFLQSILKIEPWNREARESLASLDKPEDIAPATLNAGLNAEELYANAQKLVQQEELNDALTRLEELVALYPEFALGHNDLGVIRYRLGDIAGSQNAYETAVKLQPANLNFQKNLADLMYAALGRTDDAIQIYLELHRKFPRDVETLLALGQILTANNHPIEAKSFFRRALEVEPWNRDARAALQGA